MPPGHTGVYAHFHSAAASQSVMQVNEGQHLSTPLPVATTFHCRAKDEPPAAPPSHLNAAREPDEKSRFFRSLHVTQEIIQKGKEKNAVPLLVIFIYYHLPARSYAYVQTFTF